MNRWMLIRRLRGPAFLLMFGVTALLHEWHILSFGQSWPLYLVLAGVLTLAERAAFTVPDASQMPPQYPPYRRRDVGRIQRRRRDLVEQRLKQVMVAAVDHRQPHRSVLECLRRRDPAESAADDHDMLCR